jgi:hypothetical protein
MGIRIGWLSHILCPGESWCKRCQTTWNFVTPHDIPCGGALFCFALCEKCWNETSLQQRIGYHRYAFGKCEDWKIIESNIRQADR